MLVRPASGGLDVAQEAQDLCYAVVRGALREQREFTARLARQRPATNGNHVRQGNVGPYLPLLF